MYLRRLFALSVKGADPTQQRLKGTPHMKLCAWQGSHGRRHYFIVGPVLGGLFLTSQVASLDVRTFQKSVLFTHWLCEEHDRFFP